MTFGPADEVLGRQVGSTASFVAASGGREWGGRPDRPGDEDLEDLDLETLLFVSSPSSSSFCFFFICVKGGGASGNARRRHPSRLFFFMAIGTAGPKDETEGCPRSECAIRHERGHPE